MMRERCYRGSSLPQLLQVSATVVLTALLISIFYPLFFHPHGRENARRASCQSNLKQIALAYSQYAQDYNDKLPPVGTVTPGIDDGWLRRLQSYTKYKEIFICPSNKFSRDTGPGSVRYTNYYFNSNFAGDAKRGSTSSPQVLVIGEGEIASSNYACSRFSSCTGLNENGPVGAVPAEAVNRHMDGSNFAFRDGHVKWFKAEKMADRPGKNISVIFGTR